MPPGAATPPCGVTGRHTTLLDTHPFLFQSQHAATQSAASQPASNARPPAVAAPRVVTGPRHTTVAESLARDVAANAQRAAERAATQARSFSSVVTQHSRPENPTTLAGTVRPREASSPSSSDPRCDVFQRIGSSRGSACDGEDTHMGLPDEARGYNNLHATVDSLHSKIDSIITEHCADKAAMQALINSLQGQVDSLQGQASSLASQLAATRMELAAERSANQRPAQTVTQPTSCSSQPTAVGSTPQQPMHPVQPAAQPVAASQPSGQPVAGCTIPTEPIVPPAQPWRSARQQHKKQLRQRRRQQAAASPTQTPQPAQHQTPAVPAPRAPRMRAGIAQLVDSLSYRHQFTMECPLGSFPADGPTVTAQLTHIITSRMQVPSDSFTIVEATRIGRTKAFFSVSTLDQADILVRHRCKLKGSGFTLHEVLSPAECILHAKLWPQFQAARAAGRHAQFSRAQLKIDGVVVRP